MLAFFRRLFSKSQASPDNAVLSEKLKNAARECDLWHGLYLEEKRAKEVLSGKLEQETTRNRLREDDLLNNTLRHFKLPFPRHREETDIEKTEETAAEATEDKLLETRAADYCEQVYGEGYSQDQFDIVLAGMKANPAYYLAN